MKTGILTFHDGINYGAFFQVYAMQQYLKSKGYPANVINYKSFGFTRREYSCFFGVKRSFSSNFESLCKVIEFKKAQRKLNLTERMFNPSKLSKKRFERIVIGSDEVWNFNSELIGFDPVYFSQGLNAERVISYAASFGAIDADTPIPKELVDLLRTIKHLSVRDNNSQAIIQKNIGIKPPIVLDPTFLYDLGQEMRLPKMKDYVLVYGAFDELMARSIIEYARVNGKRIVAVGYKVSWADINLCTLNPFEWLGFFANSFAVITTMFHGMIFSILNRGNFCIYKTPYRTNKIGSFMEDIGVGFRHIKNGDNLIDAFSREVDYENVFNGIMQKKEDSERFIVEALS